MERSLAFEKQDLANTKERLERSNYLLENEMNNYKRALEQEREKSRLAES